MNARMIPVQVEHDPVSHAVQTDCARAESTADRGPRRAPSVRSARSSALRCTLLELVEAIGEVTADDREVVATVIHLLESGQVQLCGNFRDEPLALILAS